MQKKGFLWLAPTTLLALAVACGGNGKQASPTSPSTSAALGGVSAASDAVTLKVNAPVLTDPVGGKQLQTTQVTLVFQPATAKYVSGETFAYHIELKNPSGVTVDEQVVTTTSYTVTKALDFDTTFSWRVRAERDGQAGPWSDTATFRSVQKVGYIRGNELYDPLVDGRTVGTIMGNVQFIKGVGAKILDSSSWIEYRLQGYLEAGEFSMLVTNLNTDGQEGEKTKVMAMKEGDDDITTNEYRYTIEKRGNGTVAWRVIAGSFDHYIETSGNNGVPPTRLTLPFHEDLTYFFKTTWGGDFNLQIREGGIGGHQIYEMGYDMPGRYTPDPHVIMVGCSRSGRSGPQSVPGMIVREVWVSGSPRPSWAQ